MEAIIENKVADILQRMERYQTSDPTEKELRSFSKELLSVVAPWIRLIPTFAKVIGIITNSMPVGLMRTKMNGRHMSKNGMHAVSWICLTL